MTHPWWRVAGAALTLALLAAYAGGLIPFGIPGQYTWRYLPLPRLPAMWAVLVAATGAAAIMLPRLDRLRTGRYALVLVLLFATVNLAAFLLHYDRICHDDLSGQLKHFAANALDNSYLHDAWRIRSLPAFLARYPELMPRLQLPHNPHQPPLKIVAHWLLLHLAGDPRLVPLLLIVGNSVFPALVLLLTGNRAVAAAAVLLPQAVIFAVTPDLTAACLVTALLVATERGSWWWQAALVLVMQYWSFAVIPLVAGWVLYHAAARLPFRPALFALATVLAANLPLHLFGLDYLRMLAVMRQGLTGHIGAHFPVDYLQSLAYLPGEYLIFTVLPLLFALDGIDRRRLAVAAFLVAGMTLSGASRFENARTWLFITPFVFAALRDWQPPRPWLTAALAMAGLQIIMFKHAFAFYCY